MKSLCRVFNGMVCLGVALVAIQSHADVVQLKNGDSVEGDIEVLDESRIAVDVPRVGRVIFSRSEIEAIKASTQESPAGDPPVLPASADAPLTDTARIKPALQATTLERANSAYQKAKASYSAKKRDCEEAIRQAQFALTHFARAGGSPKTEEMKNIIYVCRDELSDARARIREAVKEGIVISEMTKKDVLESWGPPDQTAAFGSGYEKWTWKESFRGKTLYRSVTFNKEGEIVFSGYDGTAANWPR